MSLSQEDFKMMRDRLDRLERQQKLMNGQLAEVIAELRVITNWLVGKK
jgi:tetrahydromethanopterin S-methyltransferase subunit G